MCQQADSCPHPCLPSLSIWDDRLPLGAGRRLELTTSPETDSGHSPRVTEEPKKENVNSLLLVILEEERGTPQDIREGHSRQMEWCMRQLMCLGISTSP